MSFVKVGVLTVSDRASKGIYEDKSGAEIKRLMKEYIKSTYEIVYKVIPDECEEIEQALVHFSDKDECALVLTTGGTGPTLRDVTPEATENVCSKILPGFGELMRLESLKFVPTAILSRQTAGIRKKTLIVNLPGKPNSIRECLQVVFPAIPYCLKLIGNDLIEMNS